MVDIAVLKVLGSCWITVMSAIGIWTPFLCVGRTGGGLNSAGGTRLLNARHSYIPSGKVFLSLANCFSAGMLLTMALAHFFPSALHAADSVVTPTHLCWWMLLGIVLPALLEHGAAGGDGGHTHGHGHSHGIRMGHEDPPSTKASRKSSPISTASLLILLMCIHGMTEGVLLGLEQRTSTLVGAAIPLSIHRFFDGLVIGVSMANEVIRGSKTEADGSDTSALDSEGYGESQDVVAAAAGGPITVPLRRSSAVSVVVEKQRFSICGRRVWQPVVVMWLALTPVTTVIVILLASAGAGPIPDGPPVVLKSAALSDGMTTSAKHIAGTISTPALAAAAHSRLRWTAIAQALGSGSFIYISMTIFLHEELKGLKADLALVVGIAFTFLLFSIPEEGH